MLLDAVPCSKICVTRRACRWSSCPWRITATIEKGSAKRQLVATTSTQARTGGRLRRLRDDLCVSVSILERVNRIVEGPFLSLAEASDQRWGHATDLAIPSKIGANLRLQFIDGEAPERVFSMLRPLKLKCSERHGSRR